MRTLQFRGYDITPTAYETVKKFIETWHYSHNTNGIKIYQCFAIWRYPKSELIPEMVGAMIYGAPAMNNQADSWHPNNPTKCIELRRLCCIDNTPRNIESYFIGYTLRWLKKHTDIEMIISYADPQYGHQGIIYKASNFVLVGKTAPGKILMVDNKPYHDRTLRNPKPYARRIKERFLQKDPNVYLVDTPGKLIYTYNLRK